MNLCKLCFEKHAIKNSHIISGLISKWIKDTSVTKKMRNSKNPNKRIQDTEKSELLCRTCELKFGSLEKYFSEKIFKPVLNAYNPVIDYNQNLLKFATSLSWRILVASIEQYPWKEVKNKKTAKEAEKCWRTFLYNNGGMSSYEHHMLMLRLVRGAPDIKGTNVNINWYFFRTIDATIVENGDNPFVYAKIPGFLIVSPLTQGKFTLMENTLIDENGTFDFYSQKPNRIFEFLDAFSVKALSLLNKLSKRQLEIIEKSYDDNSVLVSDSYGFKLFLAESNLPVTARGSNLSS